MILAKKIGMDNFELGVYLQLEADATKVIEKNHQDDDVRCAFKILTAVTWKQTYRLDEDLQESTQSPREGSPGGVT